MGDLPSVHLRVSRRSTQRQLPSPGDSSSVTPAHANDVFYATRPPFDPGSARTPSYVEELWSPALLCLAEKSHAKAKAVFQLRFFVPKHRGAFLSRAGPHSRLALLQAEHHP